jgi:hypothetical protein
MFISTEEYIKRISYALEHVVLPDVESEFARGQLIAAIFLLDQLIDRVDYKAELVTQEIDLSYDTIKKIIEGVAEKAGDAPDELKAFLEELEKEDCGKDLKLRDQANEMLCKAIDLFFAHRKKMDPVVAHEINGVILEHFSMVSSRDLNMMKTSTGDRLVQSKEKS